MHPTSLGVTGSARGSPSATAHPGDDTLGFPKTLREDKEIVNAPERLQIGRCDGVPAAVLALAVLKST
jgi:hypothetical protein